MFGSFRIHSCLDRFNIFIHCKAISCLLFMSSMFFFYHAFLLYNRNRRNVVINQICLGKLKNEILQNVHIVIQRVGIVFGCCSAPIHMDVTRRADLMHTRLQCLLTLSVSPYLETS